MSDQDLPVEARLEAHALLDRLTRNGSTFSREDAKRLIALLPVTPRRRFSFTGLFQSRGPGFRGRAAGVGDVELDGEGREKRVSWNAAPVHRIGGYLITHTPGQVVIELLWIATREDASGQGCQLLYDGHRRAKGDGDFGPADPHAAVRALGLHFLSSLEDAGGVTSRGG